MHLAPKVLSSLFLVLAASAGQCAPNIDSEKICEAEATSCIDVYADTDYRDRAGLRRDTYYFLSYQVVTVGVLYLMPESVTGWTDEQKENYSLSIWWDNVRNPTWDTDDAYINYITHPYWGAAYFVRARERGYNSKAAFWYSAGLSAAFEFGVEALFEPPSVQDLIITPVFGSLLGHYFMGVRDNVRERSAALGYRTTGDKWKWVLTDPLGAMNRMVDGWFGRDVDLQIRPYLYLNRRVRDPAFDTVEWKKDRIIGLDFQLRW